MTVKKNVFFAVKGSFINTEKDEGNVANVEKHSESVMGNRSTGGEMQKNGF